MNRQWWKKIRWLAILLIAVLTLGLSSCGDRPNLTSSIRSASARAVKIKEVAPPPLLRDLRRDLDAYQPQVQILSPRAGDILQEQRATVRFAVQDLPLFKDETFGLGPHLHVFLDDQPYQAVYDPSTPLVLEDLAPGTHTIRAFASRPWHESFKNEGAFAQTTFHVFAANGDHAPQPDVPLLTYSRPQGSYGAEPIMLDFYLTQAPIHDIAQTDGEDEVLDWTIRCTVNGESFEIDEWRPIYLKGFKPGQNWVQLELLDENGQAIANVFNNTVRLINYAPNGDDALSQLIRNEVPLLEARRIVIPGYEPPAPAPEVVPEVEPEPTEMLDEASPPESLEVPIESVNEMREPEGQEPPAEPEPESADLKPVPSVQLEPTQEGADAAEEAPVEIVTPEPGTKPGTEPGNAAESALEQKIDELGRPQATLENSLEETSGEAMDEAIAPSATTQGTENLEARPEAAQESGFAAEATSTPAEPERLTAVAPRESDREAARAESPNAVTTQGQPETPEFPPERGARESRDSETWATKSKGAALAEADQRDRPRVSEQRPEIDPADPKVQSSPSRPPSSAVARAIAPEVTPSPILNTYETKAILAELDEIEQKMEDLKGSIALAAEQEPDAQLEEVRSQLEQLRSAFGETWQRLSDFMQMKLRN
jgi:hypothetical protein